jgi:threonine aldolase
VTSSDPTTLVDLRSDTVTKPTRAMRAAMAEAEVGDDLAGEDPTVNRLQSLAAALLGKEAALYVPSGTMANQLALRALTRPGTDVLCAPRAHTYCYEDAGAARNVAVQMRPISWSELDSALAGSTHHLPPVSLVTIENTYMAQSGAPMSVPVVEAVASTAHAAGVPVHCDGARIFNAAIALGVEPSVLVAPCDTVMFCLSKGLGAPIGSLLCGPTDVIDRARAERHRIGGGWRQAGIVAAAGIVALETMVERLADDHARARSFAEALAAHWPGSVEPAEVRTNIVCAATHALAPELLAVLAADGVLAGTIDAHTTRFVFHADVDDAGLAHARAALDRASDVRHIAKEKLT